MTASIADTPPSKTNLNAKNPTISAAMIPNILALPDGRRAMAKLVSQRLATPITSPSRVRSPPALHASVTGGIEISTVARPPRATNPITPTLKRPAKPHCKFTPKDMMALISPILRINKALFQLCKKPVNRMSNAIAANRKMFLYCAINRPFL